MLSKGSDVTAGEDVKKTSIILPRPKARLLIAVLIILAMLSSMTAVSYAITIKTVYVSLEGQILKHAALESDGVLFLPLRAVSEALGYSAEWSEEDWSITVKDKNKTVLFEPKKDTVTDAGHSYLVNGEYPAYGYIGGGCVVVSDRAYVDSGIMESCFGITKAYNQASNTWELSVLPKGDITVENKKIYTEDSEILTDIQYPHIITADQSVSDKINAVILADVEAAQKEFRDNLEEMAGYQSPNRFEIYFNYNISYRKGGLLSLALTDYQYLGGAHGSDRQISHTFDLDTGKEYTLADLMESGPRYTEYISESIKAAIVERELAEAQLTEFVSIADDQSYYLTNKGLVVYFQRYEYFPGAAGIQEFEFTWADLTQYLKPEFQVN